MCRIAAAAATPATTAIRRLCDITAGVHVDALVAGRMVVGGHRFVLRSRRRHCRRRTYLEQQVGQHSAAVQRQVTVVAGWLMAAGGAVVVTVVNDRMFGGRSEGRLNIVQLCPGAGDCGAALVFATPLATLADSTAAVVTISGGSAACRLHPAVLSAAGRTYLFLPVAH